MMELDHRALSRRVHANRSVKLAAQQNRYSHFSIIFTNVQQTSGQLKESPSKKPQGYA